MNPNTEWFHSHKTTFEHCPFTDSARKYRDGPPWGPTRRRQRERQREGGGRRTSWLEQPSPSHNHLREYHDPIRGVCFLHLGLSGFLPSSLDSGGSSRTHPFLLNSSNPNLCTLDH
ncbi:unnamed protein product [Lupinus luteus]|uniref:Uncharacterized protein n=1 Tax=Lupinus luteus TaxID=3873 RepID=A0AAV1WVU7_LUPLU